MVRAERGRNVHNLVAAVFLTTAHNANGHRYNVPLKKLHTHTCAGDHRDADSNFVRATRERDALTKLPGYWDSPIE